VEHGGSLKRNEEIMKINKKVGRLNLESGDHVKRNNETEEEKNPAGRGARL